MQITIHKKHKHIYKYIKQKKDKKSTGTFVPKVFRTHDESSPPVPFHLAASKVIIVSAPLRRSGELEPHYASIRIHYVNMFVYKDVSSITNKLRYIFSINHVQLNLGYVPLIIFQNV